MTNANSSNCKHADSVVTYMYGELSAAEASSFESHLLDCTACTDEFAETSSARYEVYEWKKLEFDRLATPAIKIPVRDEVAEIGLIDKIRQAFGGWAVPGVAFAGLAVAVLTGGLLWDNSESDVAAVKSVEVSRPAEITRTEPAVEKPAGVPDTLEVESKQIAARPQKRLASDQPPRKPVKVTKAEPLRTTGVKLASAGNDQRQVPTIPNKPRNVPTLNEFVEDEDTSLRLAQLFDDIDTSN